MVLNQLSLAAQDWLREAFDAALDEYVDDPVHAASSWAGYAPGDYALLLTDVARELGVPEEKLSRAGRALAFRRLPGVRLPRRRGTAPAAPLTWAQEAVSRAVAEFFADPSAAWDVTGDGADVYAPHAYLARMRVVAGELGLDPEEVITARTTPAQRARVEDLLRAEPR